MILTPSTAAPCPPMSSPVSDKSSCATTHVLKTLEFNAPVQPENQQPVGDEAPYEQHSAGDFLEQLKVPTVVLETPTISHTMAAALSLSLLGHTLFLKNQVPFPVVQLSRMPGGKSNPKVAKRRDELLATFDTLASHFHTTFVSLSTAYANCKSQRISSQVGENTVIPPQHHANTAEQAQCGTAHLMFVMGTSVGAARARILLTIDGLEVKVWGARGSAHKDEPDTQGLASDGEESDEEESEDEESEAGDNEESSEDEFEEDENEESEGVSEPESEYDCGGANDEDGSERPEPPPSRSPSPSSPLTRSLAPSPESIPSPPTLSTPTTLAFLPKSCSFTFEHPPPPPPSAALADNAEPTITLASPAVHQAQGTTSPETTPTPPAPELTYAEEQQALRAAERLLSRTLMNAWVDGGGDMSSELAPTQTHIYLRAPRRFAHPAWAARQNLTRSLDGVLQGFLEDAGAVPLPPGAKGKTKSKGVRTEGAWICCRGGSAFAGKAGATGTAPQHRGAFVGEEGVQGAVENEEDEEIWWAWDGKIVGFADW